MINQKIIENLKKTVLYMTLLGLAMVFITPLLWTVSTSLKEPGAVFTYPPQFIPKPIVFRNYIEAWNAVPFGRFYINTIIYAVTATVGTVFCCALAGYAFARLEFPGRDQLFIGYLATMMVPGAVTMIPIFITIKLLGWVDTYQGLIIPAVFGNPWGTFFLRQFFITIPKELDDAAAIDGCGKFRTFWKIYLPLSKPAIATLGTFTFIHYWNDFMWPLIVLNSMEKKTLPVGLASFQGLYSTDWRLLMAGSIIVILPLIILYLYNQKFFTKGIAMTGLKI